MLQCFTRNTVTLMPVLVIAQEPELFFPGVKVFTRGSKSVKTPKFQYMKFEHMYVCIQLSGKFLQTILNNVCHSTRFITT